MSELTEYLKANPCTGFNPVPTFQVTGNLVHWYWDDAPSYAEPVHHDGAWVGTVHRALNDRRVVGVTIMAEAIIGFDKLVESWEGPR